jgi:predicted ATPase/DNA-binding winged helix-turn-helix (wHTH) protein
MSRAVPSPVYVREPWEIDSVRRELRLRGKPVVLGGRALDVVAVLAQAAGELVTKDDLMARVWPDVTVGENTLHVHIHAIRKALGADRGMLKSISGHGYRLVGTWTARQGDTSRTTRPAVRLVGQPPSNLPANVNQLIGRSGSVQRVRDLISAYRVVTLTGSGGIGKTTLVTEAARHLLADFEHGAWIVELSSLSDWALAPAMVAGVLNLTIGGERVGADSLARAIGDRQILLVLDNCEHLIDAAAALVETLTSRCPRVTVLATSREAMRIPGESVYRVPALEVPDPGEESTENILACSAVELFITRAKALDSGFSPTKESLPAIGEICRQLDGLPLAIEFAAARASVIDASKVLAGLRDRFGLLTSGRRTAMAHHRTLRATLDWSYQLLPAREQRLLRQLAVFPASFAFEAVQAVGADGRADQPIIDELTSLVSKSLCERVEPASPTRWKLLNTVRAYALEALNTQGEYAAAARRHAEHYRDVVQPVAASPSPWLDRDDVARCAIEIDNVRTALDWAFSPDGDEELGVSLTIAFGPVWQSMSLLGECRERIDRMLATRPSTAAAKAGEWRMWVAYSHALAMTLRPIEGSRAAVKRAIELATGNMDPDLQAGLLHVQWSVEFTSGAHRSALQAAKRLVAVTSLKGDAMKLAGERILGASLLFAGELTAAQGFLQRVVDLYVPPSDGHQSPLFRRDPEVLARVRLARVLALRGYLDRAFAEALSSFDRARAAGAGITVCWVVHDALCPIALMRGDLGTAERAIAAMNDWATRLDAALWKTIATCWQGKLALDRGELNRGVELLSPTLEACERSGWQMGYVGFLANLADGLAGSGQVDKAHATLDRAIAAADRNGEGWCRAELKRLKGEFLLRQSDSTAEDWFREAIGVAREQGALSLELRAALGLAKLHLARRPNEDVKPLLVPIYDRFTEGFDTADLRKARSLMDWSLR